jgi:hypothetical protein
MRISINKVQIRKSLIHLYTAIGFAVVSLVFYSPLLDGKRLFQSDINQYEGMSREITDNRDAFSEEIYWIDNAFGGMPTFQLGAKFAYDILAPIHMLFRFIPRPAHTLFLYLLTIYSINGIKNTMENCSFRFYCFCIFNLFTHNTSGRA